MSKQLSKLTEFLKSPEGQASIKEYLEGLNAKDRIGKKANKREMKTYGNMFTDVVYIYRGWVFNLMHGQGTVVQVSKI